MRVVTLNAMSAGMTRLRTKGGANPETLYEITNGYVTAAKTLKQRPAVRYQCGVAVGSKGLTSFNGVFYTFSATALTPVAGSTNRVLVHPTPGFSGTLVYVHFAHPFMGLLYVVAEFSDGGVYHYWLQDPPAWTAFTLYQANQLVQPTAPNGLYYRAFIDTTAPNAWRPLTQYSTGDNVQPTTYNGFFYSATNLLPSSPTSSSDTEPTWPTAENSFVLESSAGGNSTQPAPPSPPAATAPGREAGGRYSNPGGTTVNRLLNPTPRTP